MVFVEKGSFGQKQPPAIYAEEKDPSLEHLLDGELKQPDHS
jgi:hypothetical protein